jgi:hypothetical protein
MQLDGEPDQFATSFATRTPSLVAQQLGCNIDDLIWLNEERENLVDLGPESQLKLHTKLLHPIWAGNTIGMVVAKHRERAEYKVVAWHPEMWVRELQLHSKHDDSDAAVGAKMRRFKNRWSAANVVYEFDAVASDLDAIGPVRLDYSADADYIYYDLDDRADDNGGEAGIEWLTAGSTSLGARVTRVFNGVAHSGTVTKWAPADGGDQALWRVSHDDGDQEDLDEEQLAAAIAMFNNSERAEPAAHSQSHAQKFRVGDMMPTSVGEQFHSWLRKEEGLAENSCNVIAGQIRAILADVNGQRFQGLQRGSLLTGPEVHEAVAKFTGNNSAKSSLRRFAEFTRRTAPSEPVRHKESRAVHGNSTLSNVIAGPSSYGAQDEARQEEEEEQQQQRLVPGRYQIGDRVEVLFDLVSGRQSKWYPG